MQQQMQMQQQQRGGRGAVFDPAEQQEMLEQQARQQYELEQLAAAGQQPVPPRQAQQQPPLPAGQPPMQYPDGAMAGGDLAQSPSGPVGQPPAGRSQRPPVAHERPVAQDAPTSAARAASAAAARPPRAGKLARIVIGSFVTHDLGPRPSGERGYIIGVDDRPPYLLTMRTESGAGSIKVPKGQCTPTTPSTPTTPGTPGTPVANDNDNAAVAAAGPAPMALACDECHKWLAPEDVVHTTFGTAAHDPKAAHLDFCAPCLASGAVPAGGQLTLMTVTARVEAARAAALEASEQQARPGQLSRAGTE